MSGIVGVARSSALAVAITSTGKFDMAIGMKAVIIRWILRLAAEPKRWMR